MPTRHHRPIAFSTTSSPQRCCGRCASVCSSTRSRSTASPPARLPGGCRSTGMAVSAFRLALRLSASSQNTRRLCLQSLHLCSTTSWAWTGGCRTGFIRIQRSTTRTRTRCCARKPCHEGRHVGMRWCQPSSTLMPGQEGPLSSSTNHSRRRSSGRSSRQRSWLSQHGPTGSSPSPASSIMASCSPRAPTALRRASHCWPTSGLNPRQMSLTRRRSRCQSWTQIVSQLCARPF
mmetsp:Transcript_351/g.929  ORF Transcript_351/g.929 Transcript_351/m.929 type:complete len:233 (-) Transcript_351:551-1249(-)